MYANFDLIVAMAARQQAIIALQHASVSLASATPFVLRIIRVGFMPNSAWHVSLASRLALTAFDMSPKAPMSADSKPAGSIMHKQHAMSISC